MNLKGMSERVEKRNELEQNRIEQNRIERQEGKGGSVKKR